jgi:iron(III) transport system ATP-binding protein
VGRFLGDTMLLAGRATGSTVDCVLGTLDLVEPATGEVLVMVRPEQVVIGASSDPAACVVSVAYHGPDAMVRLDLPGTEARLVARVPGRRVPEPGDKVGVTVTTAVRAFPAQRVVFTE